MLLSGQEALIKLMKAYPELFPRNRSATSSPRFRSMRSASGNGGLSVAVSVIGVITLLVYVILLPLMVFFFLKDKHRIAAWTTRFMPDERRLLHHVWTDVDRRSETTCGASSSRFLSCGG